MSSRNCSNQARARCLRISRWLASIRISGYPFKPRPRGRHYGEECASAVEKNEPALFRHCCGKPCDHSGESGNAPRRIALAVAACDVIAGPATADAICVRGASPAFSCHVLGVSASINHRPLRIVILGSRNTAIVVPIRYAP
jgi:hypothetical protein